MDAPGINLHLVIEGCRKENRQSQRKLYEHFYRYGMSICLRYSRNQREAEEIYNDGFLKAFRHLDRYDDDYPFAAWLRRILVNSAVDYYRRYRKHSLSIPLGPDFPSWPSEAAEFPDIGEGDPVMPVVQRLPPAYRLVFNLYVMEEYPHQEIAQMLGISVNTSKSNLSRAKALLRRWLLKDSKAQGKIVRHG